MEINDLTPAEARVWRAFPHGEIVDFRTEAGEDAANGGDWGPERTLRARVLRTLLVTAPREDGEISALRITGARITGELDLTHAVLDRPVRMSHCHFTDRPGFYGLQVPRLSLRGSVMPGLDLAGARVDGMVQLSDCRVRGRLMFAGTQIAGALHLGHAELLAPEDGSPALQLNQATIGDDLWAPGLRAHGELRLTGATVSGSIDLSRAQLTHDGRPALDAEILTVEGHLLLRHTQVRGWIGLRAARITGRVDLSYACLSNPGGPALRASSAVIGELWLRRASHPVRGTLNLRRAQLDVLFAEPEMIPDRVHVSGLVYTTLTPHEPAEHRLPMLERDADGYAPDAYEQLTAAYRRIGDDDAARLVQLAKQRRHRRTLPWYGRLWGHLQDVTVGYGFRPLRAGIWLLSLLAAGSAAFGLHRPPALKPAESPDFHPVFYTLDLLLPVISFGQENAFAPVGWYQTLSYVLIIMGWILATTVVAGVTRTVSRQ
ncbi:membrane-associated oxidoreductase [Streptomyces sp. NPDC093586]|uniref:membrane-associated oxidoreductase n=1 Tax=Streptomyces sp. NPDC093586 TaxID=3366042 RepID=UPI00381F36E9